MEFVAVLLVGSDRAARNNRPRAISEIRSCVRWRSRSRRLRRRRDAEVAGSAEHDTVVDGGLAAGGCQPAPDPLVVSDVVTSRVPGEA